MTDLKIILLQALPFLASIFYTLGYRRDCGRVCAIFAIGGASVYALYYFGMQAWMGLILFPLSFLFLVCIAFTRRHRAIRFLALSHICGCIIVFAFTVNSWIDIFPMLGSSLGTASLLFQNSEVKRKLTGIGSCTMFFLYAVSIGGTGMMITTGFCILSTSQSLITKKPKPQPISSKPAEREPQTV